MPLYRATITKGLVGSTEQWSNVYTLACLDAFAAESAMNVVIGIEQAVHYDIVAFQRGHVVNVANKNDQRTIVLGGTGALHHDTVGQQLPLFCTMRVVFTDRTTKPEQKYLRRPGWTDQVTAGGSWDSDFTDEVASLYVSPLSDMAEFVGPSGEPHVGGSVLSLIQNRQLGWHRRTRPGFRRGWVAV